MGMTALTIKTAVKNSKAAKTLKESLSAIPGLEMVQGGEACDAVFIEASASAGEVLSRAGKWLESKLVREVVLVGAKPDPEALIMAMRLGVQEFLPLPLDEMEIASCVNRLKERLAGETREKPEGGRVITVAGGKHGIGTTTMAVNLAFELNRTDPGSTALLDMSRPFGDAPLFLDLDHVYHWGDVAENVARLDSTYLSSVMVSHGSGLRVLPAPDNARSMPGMDAEILDKILNAMRGMFPWVVVDEMMEQDRLSAEVLSRSDMVVLNMVLSLPCLARVKRFLEEARESRPGLAGKIRLAVSRTTKQPDISLKEAQDLLGFKISWTVPDDYPATLSAINQGRPMTELHPKSAVTKAFAAMARDMAGTGGKKEQAQAGFLANIFKFGHTGAKLEAQAG